MQTVLPAMPSLHLASCILHYRRALEHASMRDRPPSHLHSADDVLLRNHTPVPAVRTVIAMIAHHEVIAFLDARRPEIVMAAIFGRHEVINHRHVVDIHSAVNDPNLVALFGNDALDE